ncbi:hypothetical protein RhiirA4_431290 [Rhizophagus irregularis]|uniref:SAM domain-containing protein n=1 Tax=Rhizophagus irregularis TaxID=588596 RepID=A0A2I1HP89_9GLOM|nr:hypothetical protein RhiirA4_431290 [Rhizophagus irregularis]
MADISAFNYLPGTCYTCQKCLQCFELSQKNPCSCQKNKLIRVKKPQHGQQTYQRAFTPNQFLPKLNQFLFDIDAKFGYNSNFNEYFSYSSCSACNSKLQRLKESDKKVQSEAAKKANNNHKKTRSNNNELVGSDVRNRNIKKRNDNNYKKRNEDVIEIDKSDEDEDNKYDDEINGDNDNNEESGNKNEGDYDDDVINEIKIQIVVKNEDTKSPIAKTLFIQPVNYKNVMNKINSVVQKILGKNIKSSDFIISYKAINARGPSNTLKDQLDFQEFISEYQRVISSGKKMSVIVAIKDNMTKKKNKKHKKNSGSENSSSSEEITLQSKKKRKSRSMRVEDLSEEEKTRSECEVHTTPCFVQDGRHLKLNPARLQLWAREIINKGTTYEVPPTYPTFDMNSGVTVNKNISTTQANQALTTPTPIVINLPNQFYQNSTNSNSHLASSPGASNLPSIGEFLSNLDQKYNYNNVYTKFEDAFLDEAITVNVIKDLSDEQLQKLGIVKIGWQKNIKQAAQKY